jgi:hypothetical protein
MNKLKPYIGTIVVTLVVLAIVSRVEALRKIIVGS